MASGTNAHELDERELGIRVAPGGNDDDEDGAA